MLLNEMSAILVYLTTIHGDFALKPGCKLITMNKYLSSLRKKENIKLWVDVVPCGFRILVFIFYTRNLVCPITCTEESMYTWGH